MKIIISSFGTYYTLNQAKLFQKNGDLVKYITGFPKSYIRNEKDIPRKKILSIKLPFLIGYFCLKFKFILRQKLYSKILRYSHDLFSRILAKNIDLPFDIFIGASAYSSDALLKAKDLNPKCITIVDHASLNEEFELEQKLIEEKKYGFKVTGNSLHKWLIDKENLEHKISDYIVLPSYFAMQTFIDKGYKKSKLIVNHFYANTKKFKKTNKRDSKFRVLFCGSIEPRKGIHYLIEAFSSLNLNNAELWIIGSLDYLKQDKNFKKFINKFSCKNIIYFNSINSNKLADYFSQCSVLVLPSIADGFGLVVIQAMSCHLPVIVSDNTGAKDIIKNGENGFITKTRNINDLSEKIKYFYKNPEKTLEMGKNAFVTVQNNYTPINYGNRWIKILKKLSNQN